MRTQKKMLNFARKLRCEMTEAELRLWYHLRSRRFGDLKIRRQHPIGPYIADFCCIEKGLVIELDGGQHSEPKQEALDERRTKFLNSRGFRVIRFWDYQIFSELKWVLEWIWDALHPEEADLPSPLPSPTGAGEGNPKSARTSVPDPCAFPTGRGSKRRAR